MGITSAATLGPKLPPPAVRPHSAAPPSSTTAAGSLSVDWAPASGDQRTTAANKTDFALVVIAPTGTEYPTTLKGMGEMTAWR